ncbi:MAG TPA: copper-binding protein [Rhodocyclaceae bacterium]
MKAILYAAALLGGLALPAAPSLAADRAVAAQSLPWTEGTVKKVNPASVTIAHGPIINLNMDAMTMSFAVPDPVQLAKLKAGDKVRFQVTQVDGRLTAIRIEPRP